MPFAAFLTILFFFGFLAAVIVLASKASLNQTKKRIAALEEFGQAYGLRLVDRLAPNATPFNVVRQPINFNAKQEYPGIGIFNIYNCRINNMLEGRDDKGRRMRTFDAQYTVSTGKSSTTYYFSLATVDTGESLPDLTIQNETMWDKIKAAFGTHDLQVGNEEFDKNFRIQCADEAFARSLIMSEMQDRLMKTRGFNTYLTAGQAVVMKASLATPQELGVMLDQAAFLADHATNPDPLSRVRYALHHSMPAPNIEEVEERLRDEL